MGFQAEQPERPAADDLEAGSLPAVLEGNRPGFDDRIPGEPERLFAGDVVPAALPPGQGIFIVGRGKEIEDPLGALAFAGSHGFIHILVSHVIVRIARPVIQQKDKSDNLAGRHVQLAGLRVAPDDLDRHVCRSHPDDGDIQDQPSGVFVLTIDVIG